MEKGVAILMVLNFAGMVVCLRRLSQTRSRLTMLSHHVMSAIPAVNSTAIETFERLGELRGAMTVHDDRMERMWMDLRNKHGLLEETLGVDPLHELGRDD